MADENTVIALKVSKASHESWKALAESNGTTLAEWMRTVLNQEVTRMEVEKSTKTNAPLNLVVKKEHNGLIAILQEDGTLLFRIEYRISSFLGRSRYFVRNSVNAVLAEGAFDFGTWNAVEEVNLTKKIVRSLLPAAEFINKDLSTG